VSRLRRFIPPATLFTAPPISLDTSNTLGYASKCGNMSTDSAVYERPPTAIKDIYKFYQKLPVPSLDARQDVIDLSKTGDDSNSLRPSSIEILPAELRKSFLGFLGSSQSSTSATSSSEPMEVFEVASIPGKPFNPHISTSSEEGRSVHISVSPAIRNSTQPSRQTSSSRSLQT
jgi:hypothetical protein